MNVNKMSTKKRKEGKALDSKTTKRLIKLRGKRTQKEVADAVGVKPMSISYYESGTRTPRDEVKQRLAKYYKVTVQYLFFDN